MQDLITQVWVKVTGRRYDPRKDTWLQGPLGDHDLIRDKFFHSLAEQENLDIVKDPHDAGLLESFDVLELSDEEASRLQPEVRRFYEKTSRYRFEIWSEWCGFFRPFGWMLSVIFSKRLQQLNLPLNALHAAKGIQSHIIKLVDKKERRPRWTVWYRILKSTRDVIYSGVYTSCSLPHYPGKFLKVVFPLPNGNATVIMRREILDDGSLRLVSDGRRFGDNGFYFTLTNHKGAHWARFVPSMHEWIRVYVDEENMLRADHHLYYFGRPFLKLHYKMEEKKSEG